MQNCNDCNHGNVSYFAWESMVSSFERTIKKLWVVVIVLSAIIAGMFAGFVIYESMFETVAYEQDGEGVNNVNIGSQGDINYGSESDSAETPQQ